MTGFQMSHFHWTNMSDTDVPSIPNYALHFITLPYVPIYLWNKTWPTLKNIPFEEATADSTSHNNFEIWG